MRLWTILLLLLAIEASAQPIRWQEQYPGVWKGTFGKPDNYTLLSAAGTTPQAATLERLQSVDFPLPKMEVHAELIDGKTYLRFPLQKNEQI
ncbi:MAG TPA: ABC transporter substrate-binding protein, partial [Sphingobacterium sp.]|nr:ABC transporter substrate-binding protein [Sphingobacterium sp.]